MRALILAAAFGLVTPGCIIVAETDSFADTKSRRYHLSSEERANSARITSLADLPTVERRYGAQLAALTPETTVEAFKSRFPEAAFVERKAAGASNIDAYAVRIDEKVRYRDHDFGYLAHDEQWFYFRDGRYVKFGEPGQWP